MSLAVTRIASVLQTFTAEEPVLSLAECSRRSGLNKSTTHRMLQSLEEAGFTERTDDGWRLGATLVQLAMVRLGALELRREALRHLRALREAFHAAVAFSVPDGHHMLYLERLDSPDAFGVSARLGSRAPIWSGGSGKSVLAALPPEQRAERLASDEWHRLPRDVRERIDADIEDSAARGYCVDRGEFFDGIGGVAVAVRDLHGDPIAALSVIEPRERLSDERVRQVAERLMAEVAALERAMGNR
jgi:IclR family pca regulon transcriptional regulator